MTATTIGNALFTKTQQKVLGLLYGKPDRSFYTNEIVRLADMGRGTVRRELERFEAAGLLIATREGNQLHYRANRENPVYAELQAIVRKTFGIADVLHAELTPVADKIDLAFIYGSVARGEDTSSSDIDLLVVTDALSYAELMSGLEGAEKLLGRSINPSMYTAEQIKNKLVQKNSFLTRLMDQPKLWLKGSEDVFGSFGESGENQAI